MQEIHGHSARIRIFFLGTPKRSLSPPDCHCKPTVQFLYWGMCNLFNPLQEESSISKVTGQIHELIKANRIICRHLFFPSISILRDLRRRPRPKRIPREGERERRGGQKGPFCHQQDSIGLQMLSGREGQGRDAFS